MVKKAVQVSATHFTPPPPHSLKFQKGRTGVKWLAICFNFSKNPYFGGKNEFLPLFGIKHYAPWWCLQTPVFVVLSLLLCLFCMLLVKSSSKRIHCCLFCRLFFFFVDFVFYEKIYHGISFNKKLSINTHIWQRIFMGYRKNKIMHEI